MMEPPPRVMWLLNHTTARQFEVPMLKRIGVREIFLPKRIPADPAFRSASIDWSEDKHLSIPAEDLAILNSVDWYDDPGREAWEIANRHFDVVFFIFLKFAFFKSMVRRFDGAKIWRTYGLPGYSYSDVVAWLTHREAPAWSRTASGNIWFGQAYAHLAEKEPHYLKKRALFFPAGLAETNINDAWLGNDKRIFFVCPDIGFSDYYQKIYRDFQKAFSGLPFVVGGAQPVAVQDPRVLGYLPKEIHQRNMRELRVMYYHSTEPNHVHYHPFEAVRAGMPLVFMAGGLLDRLGGLDLPGRCETQKDARRKIERILNDDSRLIDSIRSSQQRLLEPLRADNCETAWRSGFQRVLERLKVASAAGRDNRLEKKRIAIIIPVAYRGGSLAGAKLLARAVETGSRRAGENIEVVFGHLDEPDLYSSQEFSDLPQAIKRRPFRWRVMPHDEASRASAYAGNERLLDSQTYQSPDDGINQFMDCDLWIIVSDRLEFPLLPVRPHVLMIYDYLQRYEKFLSNEDNQNFVFRAHAAEAVLVTTEFTMEDARQFAGVPERKIRKVPMLAPDFSATLDSRPESEARRYFLWSTNLGSHKNHHTAFKALKLYYEEYDGKLECHITGVGTGDILANQSSRFQVFKDALGTSKGLEHNLKVMGELSDRRYRHELKNSVFLWHPARIDNGTFSVVEAARFGVPALSSDYPAMHEIDQQFALNMAWMDPENPDDMARQLKHMEASSEMLRGRLPSREQLSDQSVESLSGAYWNVIRDFL